MAMVVKNNMSAVSTLNTLNKNSSALQKSLSKVSSGMKINSAQDDASGYAISERMRVQIRSLDQANQNTQNGSSMMKTAEGAVSSTVEILKSLKDKAINAANDTNKDADRVTIQKEIDQFIDQIDDNALVTFNGKYLVDGSKAQQGDATYTKMTNQSLSTDTAGTTDLTVLKNRNNESLEIKNTDYITASYVKNGETNTVKFKVGGNKLQDIFVALDGAISGNSPGATGASGTGKVFAGTNVAMTDPAGTMTATVAATPTSISQLSDSKLEKFAALADNSTGTIVTAIQNNDFTLDELKQFNDAVTNSGTDITNALDATVAGSVANTAATAVETALKAASGIDISNGGDGSVVTSSLGNLIAGGTNADRLGTDVQDALTDNNAAHTTGNVIHAGATAGAGYTAADVTAFAQGLITDAATAASGTTTAAAALTAIDGLTSDVTLTPANAVQGTIRANVAAGDLLDSDNAAKLATAGLEAAAANKIGAGGISAANITAIEDALNANPPAKTAAQTEVVMADSYVGKSATGDDVYTADKTSGLTISSANTEVENMISGVTISVTDSEGNVKKAANAALDDFKTTIFSKNESDRNELSFQVGANANQAIAVGLEDMRSEALGLKGSDGTKVSVATQDKANAAVAVFDNAIQKALDQQTTIGAIEARLEYTSQNLTTSSENVQAAESTIRDADMAKEMTNYTKNNVLLQAAQSMLAQANQSSSAVLSLLQ